jgi:hypothetical protein
MSCSSASDVCSLRDHADAALTRYRASTRWPVRGLSADEPTIGRVEDEEPRMGRRERQQREIASELAGANYARVIVLAREHLAEFPDDDDVRRAADIASAAVNRPNQSDH